jgi:pterin-4a-carbinolamine dehydratase
MKNVMKQVAAMGDPSDPATPYRIAFVNMMNAMGENDFKTAEKEGKTCIDIATAHISHNPQWAVQVAVVNIALANGQLGQKKPEKAVEHAGCAINAATPLPEMTGADMGYPVLGQSYMTRGSIHCYSKKWKEAKDDFAEAAVCYGNVKNRLMGMEANRMAGFCAAKTWQDGEAVEFLSNGFRMAENLDKNVLMTSTFPVLLKQLLSKDYENRLKYEEIDALASTVYGEEWREAIDRTWKHSPDVNTYYESVSGVTDSAL